MALLAPAPRREPRVEGLVRVVFERPDLALVERFFTDFGLVSRHRDADRLELGASGGGSPIYVAERGPSPGLRRLAFAADRAGVEQLAARHGLKAVAQPAPGVERRVTLRDPNGWFVDVEELAERAPTRRSKADGRGRDTNETIRATHRAAPIRRLGHIALEVTAFDASLAWYREELGLRASDIQVLPDGTPGLVFLRCDRGPTPVDHHTVVLARGLSTGVNHVAFEVDDLDSLAMGQRFLREAGWQHAWGIGRHLLGSQLFDYWRDPWGTMVEHYTDGDVLDEEHATGVHRLSRESFAQWGPPLPPDFIDTRITPRRVMSVARQLGRAPVSGFRTLWGMLRSLSA